MIIKCDSRQEIKHEEKGDLYCKQEGRERWGQVEKWLEVGVCKERSLEKNHLERSSKAGEGGRWDMSAKHRVIILEHCRPFTSPIYGILPECGRLSWRLNDDSLEDGSDSEPVGDGDQRPAGAEGGGEGRRVQGQAGRRCHHACQQRLNWKVSFM